MVSGVRDAIAQVPRLGCMEHLHKVFQDASQKGAAGLQLLSLPPLGLAEAET